MKVLLCDVCKKEIVNFDKPFFEIDGDTFRVTIVKLNKNNGIRWKQADVCKKCLIKHSKNLIEKES